MSSRLGSLTNHHLYLAKLLRQELELKLAASTMSESLLLDAWGQAVLWHLHATYRALVAELAEKAKRDLADVEHVLAIGDAAVVDCLPAELREIADLQRTGWLHAMLHASRDARAPVATSVDPLALKEVPTQYFGVDELMHWYASMDRLIDRFRETTIEC